MEIAEQIGKEVVGRITKATAQSGEAEFIPGVRINDMLCYEDIDGEQFVCRVTRIHSSVFSSADGHYKVLKPGAKVPSEFSPLYRWKPAVKKGAFILLGDDLNGNQLYSRINDLFHNTLIAGKHAQGKTKICISIAEQLLGKRVPHLIVDTQDEFSNLAMDEKAKVFHSKEGIFDFLRQRGTAVLSLGGMTNNQRDEIVADILSELKTRKESDYKSKAFKIPPIIVTVDEAEIYSPNHGSATKVKSANILVDYAKRMNKYGLGLIVVAQQLNRLHIDLYSQCNNVLVFLVDNIPDLRCLASLRCVTAAETKMVRSLSVGECLALGKISDIPIVIRTPEISTPRTKPIDYESLLGLSTETIEPSLTQLAAAENASKEEPRNENVLCGGCGTRTTRIEVKGERMTGRIKHFHLQCKNCQDEFCEITKRWINTEKVN